MKLFTDSGLEISCPSGNPIYINPISADLQQCHQQLGVYNESTCPGGTDYCCWASKTPTEDVEEPDVKPISPEDVPPFSRRGTPDRGVVRGIVERPKTVVSSEDEDEDIEEGTNRRRGPTRATKSPLPDEEDESDWESEATKPTRRPRGRKVTATTTPEPETTTKKPSNHRLPQCNNPDDTVFIDYGNRLRDCYFQQCGRGYRCEFNKYMRRFICCGKDAAIVPPPGLPPIPAPKPLNPRPLRPPQRPFGMLSDGMDGIDNSDGPRFRPRSSCCEENDCQPSDDGGRQWGRGCEGRNNRCPNHESGTDGCRSYNRGDIFGEMTPRGSPMQPNIGEMNLEGRGGNFGDLAPRGPPMQPNIQELSVDNHGSNFGEMVPRGPPVQVNIRETNMQNRGSNFGEMGPRGPPMQPSMNVDFPGNGCGLSQENENGCPFIQNSVEMGEMGRRNVEEQPMWGRGGDESPRGAMIPEPRPLQNVIPLGQNNFGPAPDSEPRRPDEHRMVEFPPPEFRPLAPRIKEIRGDEEGFIIAPSPRQGITTEDVQSLRPRGLILPPFHRMKKTDGKNLLDEPNGVEGEVCVVGTEYSVDGLVPSCDSGNSNFCPSSHPHCSHSTSLRSRVCCSQLARLSKS
ncbi:hypothetical protein ANCCAN_09325 [Ancylostoma caninum]|uniref:Uncharacterized protein n=1 Tax=Ancylostoma caninum TaxID=29170 RepID=A0A368GNM9_ANCCA|nr:hypothetical protein ANCCAN_09325 [Ancylostoma caninum]